MEISKFLGLMNTVAGERMPSGALTVARDVDIDGSGQLLSRAGQTSVSATASHSLWAGSICLVVQGSDLKRMDTDGTLTTLKRLTYAGRVAYAEFNGVVYFTNGIDTGRVVNGEVREWGVRNPRGQPAASATGGFLPAGRYLYAMTFVRDDGLESGTNHPALIELTSQGGIAFSSIETSSDPHVVGRRLYVSGPDGEELYHVATLDADDTTFTYQSDSSVSDQGIPLDPGFVEPAPPGSIVAIHGGASLVADGSVVWVSEQFSMERFRRGERFLQFPGPVQALTSVDDGLYVSTDAETYYLAGKELTSLKSRLAASTGAIPGTAIRFDAGLEGDPEDESADPKPATSTPSAMWISVDGVVMGDASGSVKLLTFDRYGIPAAKRGTAMLRSARGYTAYVVALRGAAVAGNTHT